MPKTKKQSKKNQPSLKKPATKKRSQESATKSRAEGVRLFALAGRPSKEDFILVFGNSGPRMTWTERAAAGVPAEKFQRVLAQKKGR